MDRELTALAQRIEDAGRDPYASLGKVLIRALNQAANGKGKERHAKDGEPFDKQKICEITRRVGLGYPLGQAIKKAEESIRLGPVRGQVELLGAINYLAAAVIVMNEEAINEEPQQEDTIFAEGSPGFIQDQHRRINPINKGLRDGDYTAPPVYGKGDA